MDEKKFNGRQTDSGLFDEVHIEKVLGIDSSKGKKHRIKILFVVILIFLISGMVIFSWLDRETRGSVSYRSVPVKRGNLVVTVTATGTLRPIGQVEVGVELSGTIDTVNVDCNDRVHIGQVLAKLDTSEIEAKVLQAKANFELAKARLRMAEAELKFAKSKLGQYRRVRKMTGGKLPSEIEMEEARTNLEKAIANKLIAEAEISKAKAELEYRETNLSKAIIRSPIDGIVLSRNIEPGQTVAASLKTPVLFVLAKDLTRMELHIDIDEADIGKIKRGLKAKFSVDAYPEREFEAVVKDILLSPKTTEGVVTYETILTVKNPDLLLLPGMTATADIIVENLRNVLLVPNAALRFNPRHTGFSKKKKSRGGLLGFVFPRFSPPQSSVSLRENTSSRRQKHVWIVENGVLTKVPVKVGVTDGVVTHITAGKIKEGQQVVVGIFRNGKR